MKKVLMIFLAIALVFTMSAPVFAADLTIQQKFDELKAAGILAGDAAGNMLPADKTMTRQELAKIACTLSGVAPTPGVEIAAFAKDYKKNVWGFDQGWIQAAYTSGLMKGKGATGFDSQGVVSIAELLTVVIRTMGLGAQLDNSKWEASAMEVAIANKLIPAAGVTAKEPATYAALVTQSWNSYAYNLAPAEPVVQSVTALNGKQLEVKFNMPVKPSSIITNGKLVSSKVSLTGMDMDNVFAASLDSTNTVLSITLKSFPVDNSLVKNTAYTFEISGVISEAGKPFPAYAQSIYANESVAPSIVIAVASTKDSVTRSATIVFSEPVNTPTVKVDGQFAGVAKVAPAAAGNAYTLTTTTDLEIGKSYDVEVIGLTDILGNKADNILTTQLSVIHDTVKPTVIAVNAVGENIIDVVFDKEISSGSIAVDSFKVTKLLSDGVTNQIINQANLGVLKTDKKTVRLTLSGAVFDNASQSSREVSVAVSGVTDKPGNVVVSKTSKVTLERDTIKPSVISVGQVYNNATSLNVVFSEPVTGMSTANNAVFSVVNANNVVVPGVNVTVPATSTSVDGQNVATATLSAALPATGNYKLVAQQNTISDTAGKANQNNAQSIPFAYTIPQAAVGTITAAILADIDGEGGNTVVTESGLAANRVIYVEFDKQNVVNGIDVSTGTFKVGAADNPANYTLAGAPLPTGTTVTFVTTTLKSGVALDFSAVLAKDLPAALTKGGNVTIGAVNVKTTTGATLNYTTGQVAVKDTTKPTVSAAYLADGATAGTNLVLTVLFSEDMSAVDITNDLVLTDGTIEYKFTNSEVAVKDSNNAAKWTIALLNADLSVSNTASLYVTSVGGTVTKDAATVGNNLAATTGSGILVSDFSTY